MVYSIDTSSLINLWREIPEDIVPSLWAKLESMGNKGALLVSEEVKHELQRKSDSLYHWVKNNSSMVIRSSDENVQEMLQDIVNKHAIVEFGSTENLADPWVIAVAEVYGACVVSSEKHKTDSSHLDRIPDVCKVRKIKCLRHRDFLRDAQIQI